MELESQNSPETATKKPKKMAESGGEQPMNVKIEVISDQVEKTPPIVGYFPSGYKLPESNNFEETDKADDELPSLAPAVRFYRNAQRSKIEEGKKGESSERMELVVSPRESNVEFVGKSYEGEAVAAQLCTYALGVLDKERQTLKVIMPVAGNKIFRMEPKIRGFDNSKKYHATVETEQDRMKTLQESFGTKKVIKQIKKSELLLEVGDIPVPIQDNAVINKEALNSANIYDIRNIPPHNTCATSPQEAYPLDKIVLMGEWNYLEDVLSVLQEGSVVAVGAYPTFVINRIERLQEIQNKEQKQTVSYILSFITHLIKFKDLHSIDGHFSAKNHKFPKILKLRFAQLFGLTSWVLAIEKIDLLISYVLVLTLYVDDFQTNPIDIAKDLRFSSVNLRVHFKNLGCKFVRKNGEFLATLPLPLTFPAFKRRRPR